MCITITQTTNKNRNAFLVGLFFMLNVESPQFSTTPSPQQELSATNLAASILGKKKHAWLCHSHAATLMSLLFPLLSSAPRPVRYPTRSFSAWLPLESTRPPPARCPTGTSSKPASRGRWTYLCPSGTCSSVFSPSPRARSLRGVCPPPSARTSRGRVCLCLGKQIVRVGPAAGG